MPFGIGTAVRRIMERAIAATANGRLAFLDTASFPWTADLEADTAAIRAELDDLLRDLGGIPNFQDVSEDQAGLTRGDEWKSYFFYAFGHRAEENCARCPRTAELLQRIPGMTTAMFSILAPGKHIPPHRGYYKGLLRYHLGVLIPGPPGACRIRVGTEVRAWEEGKSLVFDDTHEHEVWSDADRHRVVLFADFIRPLPFPLNVVNRLMLWALSKKASVRKGIERIRHPDMLEVARAAAEIRSRGVAR